MNNHDEVLSKLDTLLGVRATETYGTKPQFEEEMFDRMFEFIVSLDPDENNLSEDQAETIMEMIEDIELEYEDLNEEEDFLDEAPAAKRIKRDRQAQRERRKKYRKNKAKLKMKAKRYRKSAKGKMMAKKAKRMKKTGKTSTGKRIRKFY